MNANFDNKIISSFLLYLTNKVESNGGFFNVTGKFFPTTNLYNGLYSYSCQFKPLVADSSISNAIRFSGVYLNNVFITPTTSGFSGIDYKNGTVYFNTPIQGTGNISGSWSVSEFNIRLTNKPDEEILFETKYTKRPQNTRQLTTNLTGLSTEEITYPVIFIKNDGGENKEFAFGGVEETKVSVKAIILADSQFNLDAVSSVIRDTARSYFGIINSNEMPFNALGYYKTGDYNYSQLTNAKIGGSGSAYIEDVFISKFGINAQIVTELKRINPDVYPGLAEFTICSIRNPRS